MIALHLLKKESFCTAPSDRIQNTYCRISKCLNIETNLYMLITNNNLLDYRRKHLDLDLMMRQDLKS